MQGSITTYLFGHKKMLFCEDNLNEIVFGSWMETVPASISENLPDTKIIHDFCLAYYMLLHVEGKVVRTFLYLFLNVDNLEETSKLLKWLSKAIIAISSFTHCVQISIVAAEHVNKCKGINQTSYYMYHKTPEYALKNQFGILILLYAAWI